MNGKIFRGSLDTIVIKLLTDNKEMYGYEITQKVKELTGGTMNITEGALYPALHKLEGKGILETQTRSIGNRMRKYYSLTKKGKKESVNYMKEMQSFLDQMQFLLNGKNNLA